MMRRVCAIETTNFKYRYSPVRLLLVQYHACCTRTLKSHSPIIPIEMT